jgi:hypothetical protein
MKMRTTDTEIVFRDLTKANKRLRHKHKNHDAIRRWFGAFVTQSQRLTEVMRKEYKGRTGKNWEAFKFPGWTPVTTLFKNLWKTDLHQVPIRIRIRGRQVHRGLIEEISKDDQGSEVTKPVDIIIEVDYTSEAGLESRLPRVVQSSFTDSTGECRDLPYPDERHYIYEIKGITPERG